MLARVVTAPSPLIVMVSVPGAVIVVKAACCALVSVIWLLPVAKVSSSIEVKVFAEAS